jgi:hypothetical protein
MKVELAGGVKGLSGKFDGWIYRNLGDRTIVAAPPTRSKRKPSKAQVNQREQFAGSIRYAKRILEDPCQRYVYEAMARQQGRRADKLLASDFLTPPVVELIELAGYGGRVGDVIKVIASDDVEVVSVELSIQTADGQLLEQGPATKIQGVWCYTATAAVARGSRVAIIAVAKDRPANEGRAMLEYP